MSNSMSSDFVVFYINSLNVKVGYDGLLYSLEVTNSREIWLGKQHIEWGPVGMKWPSKTNIGLFWNRYIFYLLPIMPSSMSIVLAS